MKKLSVLMLVLFAAGSAHALTLTRDTRWSGALRFNEQVVIPAGVTLEIVPGTQVHFRGGGLEVAGRLLAGKVVLEGDRWAGLTLKGCDAQTRLSEVTVRGAATGILIQGGTPLIERAVLDHNEVGMELRGKSAATVRDSLFRDNRKVGLFVKDDSVAQITGCRFEAQGKYGAYLYRANPSRFAHNRFERNPVGLMVAYYGSDPVIEANDFTGNDTAVEIDRAARPLLRGNRLQGNRVGIFLQRRADPWITGNALRDNQVGIRIAYSSYPRIDGNDFSGNPTALSLEFQSSAWEREQGAAARAGEVASAGAFGGGQGAKTVTENERRPEQLDGTVDARNNWWGDDGSLELARLGETGNPSFIHDGRDQATFLEKGKPYPLDTVRFAPWSATPNVREAVK